MKTLTKITLLSVATATFVHLYLAYHFYPIKFGFSSGPSVCSINSTFDCDAVAASSYSELFGVPLALWGASANLVIFIMVLGQWWGMSDHAERLRRWSLALISVTAVASIVMGVISTQLHSYCLFCISAYALSFIAFFCYRATLQEPFFANFVQDIPHLWNESKGILLGFAAVPVLAVVGHRVALEAYGVTQLEKVVQTSINEWITAPAVNFSVPPALSMGPSRDQAKMVIAEFADFRCSHCRHAYPSLDHFAKSHPEVRLEFYNFPLDGECNEVIPDKNGISCRLAYAVTCAEKQGHGWQLHHALYDDQDKINGESLRGAPLDDEIKTVAQSVGINSDPLFQCMSEPTTADAVRLQAKLGGDAKIQGTPSIFINSKMMDRGQLIPVMEAALTASKNQSR